MNMRANLAGPGSINLNVPATVPYNFRSVEAFSAPSSPSTLFGTPNNFSTPSAPSLIGCELSPLNGLGTPGKMSLTVPIVLPRLGLGSVSDYDTITIKGKQYSVNQILDKELIATAATKVYTSAFDNATVKYTTQSGQSLGKVYSYLLPTTGRSGAWLMISTGPTTAVFVPADSADPAAFASQGAKTVDQEVKEEADAKLKDESPIEYYVKKYAGKVLLIGGGIYLATELGKQFLKSEISK